MTVHGSVSTYCKDGCRCDACKAAKARYMAEWRTPAPRSNDDAIDAILGVLSGAYTTGRCV